MPKKYKSVKDLLIILMCLLVWEDIHQCPGPGLCEGVGVCLIFAEEGHQALSAMLCWRLEIGVEWSLIADQWSNLRNCHETRDFFQTDNV